MQQIIFFFQKYKYFLFFLFLEFIAISITFNNLNFHKSKFVNSANSVTGGMYQRATAISDYLSLKEQNLTLVQENTILRNQLQKFTSIQDLVSETRVVDSVLYHQKYIYINAKIINNEYNTPFNFLTIDRGQNDALSPEMGVINSRGIIGIIDNVNSNYARVQSILNRNSKINARLKNSFYFGTLTWDGKDYNRVQLQDIPRHSLIKVGDTIETGGRSTIFPEGIPIGVVSDIHKGNTLESNVDITLFNDMSNLGFVYVVKNLHKSEIKDIENE